MPIRKIPLCPFCGSEMILEKKTPEFQGAVITTSTKWDDEYGHERITSTWTFEILICCGCGFVAFWRYEP